MRAVLRCACFGGSSLRVQSMLGHLPPVICMYTGVVKRPCAFLCFTCTSSPCVHVFFFVVVKVSSLEWLANVAQV